jgi:hypothetical protein
MARHGVSLTLLESLYRERAQNGHPEAVGRIGRGLAWDAEEWNEWFAHRSQQQEAADDTTGLETREDLQARTGLGLSTLAGLYRERETNGHPAPVKRVGITMYWDPQVWDAWYARYRAAQKWRTPVSRSGNAEDLISLAEAARVLGMQPTSITRYPDRPPNHWPAPAEERVTPKGSVKRKYRRGDIWRYGELRERSGGGRPAGSAGSGRRFPFDGDPRLATAREILAAHPGTSDNQLAGRLTAEHGGAAGTWSHILRSARQHPDD